MAETVIHIDTNKTERENFDALLIANGLKDYHVPELNYLNPTPTTEGTKNTTVRVVVKDSSILASTNGPWDVSYNRLPMAQEDSYCEINTGAELFGLKRHLNDQRGNHCDIIDVEKSLASAFENFINAENLDEIGEVTASLFPVEDSLCYTVTEVNYFGTFPLSLMKYKKDPSKTLGRITDAARWRDKIFVAPEKRANYQNLWNQILSSVRLLDDSSEPGTLLDAVNLYSLPTDSTINSAAAGSFLLNNKTGYTRIVNDITQSFSLNSESVRLTTDKVSGLFYDPDFYDIGTGKVKNHTFNIHKFVNSFSINSGSNFASSSANICPIEFFILNGSDVFTLYSDSLVGGVGTNGIYQVNRDEEGNVTEQIFTIKKSILNSHPSGLEGVFIDAVLEFCGLEPTTENNHAQIKQAYNLNININTENKTVSISAENSPLFVNTINLNYDIYNDTLDPDEPIIMPTAVGGFEEPYVEPPEV